MTGYVYAVQAGDAVKIGWAADPVRRLSELNVGSPATHKLLGFVVATKDQECELHGLLSRWRLRGEWFSIAGAVVNFINMLPSCVPLEPGEHRHNIALEKYLSKHRLTQQQFADQIGGDQSRVSRMLAGKANPSLSLLNKISQVTGGKVTANDFLQPAQTEAAE